MKKSAFLCLTLLSMCHLCLAQEIKNKPITLKDIGSFHVGGREVVLDGLPIKEVKFTVGSAKVDPNGTYQVEQLYAQYYIQEKPKGKLPLLMWHGGGLTGATWETTPDGREGFLNYFLRTGWTIYNSDAPERGRAGWAKYPEITRTEPIFLTKNNPFERFRIGARPGSYDKDVAKMKVLPGNQFPLEGYDNFTKQIVPRWTSTDEPTIAAYIQLVDRVCPCVVMSHSQSGLFAYKVAQARPDKIKALVMLEPAGVGDMENVNLLKQIPSISIYGDYIDQDPRWVSGRAKNIEFQEAIRAAGGRADLVNLPDIGIKGNSHMMMMDRNSDDIAKIIQEWLVKQELYAE